MTMERPKVHILIVEDNKGDVLLVREALEESDLNFELKHLPDGEEAYRLVEGQGRFAHEARPDLVLLDLNLPKRDGWEVLKAIRTRAEWRQTPVVILSSSGSPDDISRARQDHDAIYIRKPADLDAFLAIGRQIQDFWTGRDSSFAG